MTTEVTRMLISTRGRYALRILVDIGEHPGKLVHLREVAERQDISEKYLENLVKDLIRGGFLTGQRGKGGGYRLCMPPEKINVGAVLRLMEGSLAPVACLEENAVPCPRAVRCKTLEFWRGLDTVIREYSEKFTLADLIWKDAGGNDYVI